MFKKEYTTRNRMFMVYQDALQYLARDTKMMGDKN